MKRSATLGRSYPVRGVLVFEVGYGGPAGYRSEAFIENIFPEAARSQSIVKNVSF